MNNGLGTTETISAGQKVVVGTCVETLDDDGAYLRSGIETEGNVAICHWMYAVGVPSSTVLNETLL